MLRHQILSFIGTAAITVKLLFRLDDSRANQMKNIFSNSMFCFNVHHSFVCLQPIYIVLLKCDHLKMHKD